MRFAVALPWWGYTLAFGVAILLAWAAYARVGVTLSLRHRMFLMGLRALALCLIVAAWLRPVAVAPSPSGLVHVVPMLVDASRSMRVADQDGVARIDRAVALGRGLAEALGDRYRVEWLTFGESVVRATPDAVSASAGRSDLAAAVEEASERYRGQRVAGIVVLSDGGDTSSRGLDPARLSGQRVFTVGVGSPDGVADREILNVTAGEALLPEAAIDLSVSAVSRGFGRAPLDLRLSANGRPVEVRRVTPTADGAPVHEVFTVAPSADQPTVYTVEIPAEAGDAVSENNVRSVLVPPQTARRRILIVEGAPGFEHTFLKRALSADPGLEVDSVVRKGQNDDGQDTFFVQAGESRAAALATGYPTTREALFRYDAIVFGNVEAAFFTREQLDLTARFVAERGGGLLVLGARSFERQGLTGTPLEAVLPVDLTDRRTVAGHVPEGGEGLAVNAPAVTDDGAAHPATRLASSIEESRRLWQALPPLASVALVGGPRPGAQVLAVSASPGGEAHPLIAVQRYGQGRSLVFAGEASWRWRMMRPASDRVYDTIWRQLVRWLAATAPRPVSIGPLAVARPGSLEPVAVTVRDEEFEGVADAELTVTVTTPDGSSRTMTPALAQSREGRYVAAARFEQAGVYRIEADARRGERSLGTASGHVLVGGMDVEMSDPRLNEAVLRRTASAAGGVYLRADQVSDLPALLRKASAGSATTAVRDLWHNVWTLAAIMGLLGIEWISRRRLGLT